MGRQESPQLLERKGQVDTDAQETGRASKYCLLRCFQSTWKVHMYHLRNSTFLTLDLYESRCSELFWLNVSFIYMLTFVNEFSKLAIFSSC